MPELSLRLSQAISPFGVGGICVLNGESFVGMDIGTWPRRGGRIECNRLADVLGVDFFHYPPTKETTFGARSEKISYSRFPRWLFCMSCRQLGYWRARDEIPGTPRGIRRKGCKGAPGPNSIGFSNFIIWSSFGTIGILSANSGSFKGKIFMLC